MSGSREVSAAGGSVCLVGLRCVGKSSVGRELARLTGLAFVDLDDELVVECRAGGSGPRGLASAGEVLAALGEAAFRALELRALARLASGDRPMVLATGGGVVETPAARALLARFRHRVWLHAPVEVLAERMRGDGTPRPALLGGDPTAEIAELFARREPLYRELAGEPVDAAAGTPAELAAAIARGLGPRG